MHENKNHEVTVLFPTLPFALMSGLPAFFAGKRAPLGRVQLCYGKLLIQKKRKKSLGMASAHFHNEISLQDQLIGQKMKVTPASIPTFPPPRRSPRAQARGAAAPPRGRTLPRMLMAHAIPTCPTPTTVILLLGTALPAATGVISFSFRVAITSYKKGLKEARFNGATFQHPPALPAPYRSLPRGWGPLRQRETQSLPTSTAHSLPRTTRTPPPTLGGEGKRTATNTSLTAEKTSLSRYPPVRCGKRRNGNSAATPAELGQSALCSGRGGLGWVEEPLTEPLGRAQRQWEAAAAAFNPR